MKAVKKDGQWTIDGMENIVAHCFESKDSLEFIFKNGAVKKIPKPMTGSSKPAPVKEEKKEEKKDDKKEEN
jgi:hypothetical protein